MRFATRVCVSPETSKILIVRSDEHVARRKVARGFGREEDVSRGRKRGDAGCIGGRKMWS